MGDGFPATLWFCLFRKTEAWAALCPQIHWTGVSATSFHFQRPPIPEKLLQTFATRLPRASSICFCVCVISPPRLLYVAPKALSLQNVGQAAYLKMEVREPERPRQLWNWGRDLWFIGNPRVDRCAFWESTVEASFKKKKKAAIETKLKDLKKNTLLMNGHIGNISRKIKVYMKF